MKIVITEEIKSPTHASILLSQISSIILEGCTRGFYPHWNIEFDTEEEAIRWRQIYEESLPE